jgi:hypothetical protein
VLRAMTAFVLSTLMNQPTLVFSKLSQNDSMNGWAAVIGFSHLAVFFRIIEQCSASAAALSSLNS